jgi:hypothetical protein
MEGGAVGHNFDRETHMPVSSLTYILGFSVKNFFHPIYTIYAN